MKKRLLFAAALTLTLVLPFSRKADAVSVFIPPVAVECFEESYGGGRCGTACVMYNDQGNAEAWCVTFHAC